MMVDIILEYVRKTNKDITKEKLIEELLKCDYATKGLMITIEGQKFGELKNIS